MVRLTHSRARGTKPAKLLIMFCPGGDREKYFEGLAELLKDGQTPNRKALLELMRLFDQEPVDIELGWQT